MIRSPGRDFNRGKVLKPLRAAVLAPVSPQPEPEGRRTHQLSPATTWPQGPIPVASPERCSPHAAGLRKVARCGHLVKDCETWCFAGLLDSRLRGGKCSTLGPKLPREATPVSRGRFMVETGEGYEMPGSAQRKLV